MPVNACEVNTRIVYCDIMVALLSIFHTHFCQALITHDDINNLQPSTTY